MTNASKDEQYPVGRHQLSPRQVEIVLAAGQIPQLAEGQNPHRALASPAIAHWRRERGRT